MRRLLFCLLLCVFYAPAFAENRLDGVWIFYGTPESRLRIDGKAALLEDETRHASYVLHEERGDIWRCVARKNDGQTGETRKLFRVQKNILFFQSTGNPVLIREGARFTTPQKKIRGRWRYARQMNGTFYYDAEFDLDAKKMFETSRAANGELVRSEAKSFEILLDAQRELALRLEERVYHFTRLGADYLVLEPKSAIFNQSGQKILMTRARPDQAEPSRKAAKYKAVKTPPKMLGKAKKRPATGKKRYRSGGAKPKTTR